MLNIFSMSSYIRYARLYYAIFVLLSTWNYINCICCACSYLCAVYVQLCLLCAAIFVVRGYTDYAATFTLHSYTRYILYVRLSSICSPRVPMCGMRSDLCFIHCMLLYSLYLLRVAICAIFTLCSPIRYILSAAAFVARSYLFIVCKCGHIRYIHYVWLYFKLVCVVQPY